jgi:branched-chain amino acid transport system substrate-binding protein
MRSPGWRLVVVVCVVVVGAACSSSSKSASTVGSSTATTASSSFQLTNPLKLIGLWQIPGEASVANYDQEYGVQLAVDQINKAGGVGGKPIVYQRIPTDGQDVSKIIPAVQSALAANPSVLLGPATAAGSLAAAPLACQAGVPDLTQGQDNRLLLQGAAGCKDVFEFAPSPTQQAQAAVDFAVNNLKANKIGILYPNVVYGTAALPYLQARVKADGATVFASLNYPFNATDLTAQVLAMKGADAVINWAFPAPLGVQLNQFLQNGITIPTIDSSAAALAVETGLAKGQALANLYAATYCNPSVDDTNPLAKQFAQNMAKVHPGFSGGAITAFSYDSVYVAAAAATKARSSDPAAIAAALRTITVPGACAPEYHADAEQLMNHYVATIHYATDGTTSTVSVVKQPDLTAVP